jgi:hypothetical protein
MKKRASHGLHNHIFIDKTKRRSFSSKRDNDVKFDANNASNNNNNNNNNNSDLVSLTNDNNDINTDKTSIKKKPSSTPTGIF